MSTTTAAAPSASGRVGTSSARACSTASCRRMLMVIATLYPGWGVSSSPVSGSVFQVSLTTLPLVLVSISRVPAVPRRYSSNAFSTPSLPTVASME